MRLIEAVNTRERFAASETCSNWGTGEAFPSRPIHTVKEERP